MNGWGWTMMIVWSIVWLGFLGVAAWVAVRWARGGHQSPQSVQPPPPRTARELLDERLARGQIDPDENRLRREALEHPQAGA
jgi:putative membrane protein